MKILILNKMYHPDIGGVETITKQYAEWLSSENYEVTVLTTKRKSNFKVETKMINNVKVISHSPLFVFGSLPVSVLYLFHYLFIFKKFDIIHIHEPFPIGSFLGSFTKSRPFIITFHSDIVRQTGLLKKVSIYFLKKSLEKAKLITTTSHKLLNSSYVLSKFKSKTKIIPLSSHSNSSATYSPNSYFLFLGRLSYYKGIEVLMMALDKAKEIKRDFIIVGKGEKKIEDMIHSYSKKYNNIIFYNRFVDEKEKQDLIKNCYCFLFPSVYNSEAFGITQIEALNHGKPIINTNLDTGVPWVSVNNLTGFTVKPNNVQSLLESIVKMDLLPKNDYRLFCKNAKLRHKEIFDNKIVKKQFLNLFKNENIVYNNYRS